MPPKGMKDLLNDVYMASVDDAPVEYKFQKLTKADVKFEDDTSIYPNILRSMDVFKAWELKFNLIPNYRREAMWIYFTTGNDLYLRFPKKLRRRRRKYELLHLRPGRIIAPQKGDEDEKNNSIL